MGRQVEETEFLTQIVSKIVTGATDWSSEELQYQKNHPDLIEKALKDHYQKDIISGKVLVVHNNYNYYQLRNVKVPWVRVLTYPEAVALAMLKENVTNKETNAVVFTITENVLDMTVLTIGDGVYEVRYTGFTSPINAEKVYSLCRDAKRMERHINRLLIIMEGFLDFQYKRMVEQLFGRDAEILYNLQQLVQRGKDIQIGVLEGAIKDVLLLSVVPLAIGIEMEGGLMLPIVDANETIPTKRSCELMFDANLPKFGVEIWQGNESCAKKNDLLGVLLLRNEFPQIGRKRKMEVVINIDSNMHCKCNLIDREFNQTTELIVL